jgi:aminoglycoside phosphotransferase (APT) family kinase protein
MEDTMLETVPADIHLWAEKHIGTIQASQVLKGGISTSIFRLKSDKGDFVLRVIDNDEWLAEEADLAEHEAAALKAVAHLDIPTPQLVAYDNAAECTMPVVLSTWLPGKIVLQPHNLDTWVRELAHTLAKLHQFDAPDFQWQYRAWINAEGLAKVPNWIAKPDQWRRAVELFQRPLPATPIRLIHRDYHPANVLFTGERLTGIVDWINTCRGAVNIDVAVCRVDLICLHGVDAANQFLQYYEQASGTEHHPLWDVHGILDFFDNEENPVDVLQSWHDLGRSDLTLPLIYQRANEFLEHIIQQC